MVNVLPEVYPIWFVFTVFIIFIMRPLWLVTKERPALIIMFSRLIAILIDFGPLSIIFLAVCLIFPIDQVWKDWDGFIGDCMANVSYLHALTMALNRGVAVFFPIPYMHFNSKRWIVIQCIVTYVLGITLHTIKVFVIAMTRDVYFSIILGVYTLCAIVYIFIAIRMFIYKYSTKSWVSRHAAAEKDALRITLCCGLNVIANIFYTLLYFNWFYNYVIRYKLYNYSTVLMGIYLGFDGIVPFVTEELCLMALCTEFRQKIWAQCGAVWAWMRCKKNRPNPPGIGVGNRRIVVGNPRRIGEAVRVNNFVGN